MFPIRSAVCGTLEAATDFTGLMYERFVCSKTEQGEDSDAQ